MKDGKIRVAFINIYQDKALRGAETFVSELSNRLKKKFEVDVISGKKELPKRWPFLWRTFMDPQGLSIFAYTLSLLPRLIKGHYDIIIPVNGGFMPAVIRILTWFTRGKLIVSGQSGMGWDERNNLWCFPDLFIALSPEALKWAGKVNPLVKSVYIPNGVDTSIFTSLGKKAPIKLSHPIFLCVAALTKAKRINLAIKAVSKINGASFLLVGSRGESEKELLSLGHELLGDRFLYKNYSHEDMPSVYRSVDVFTLVSLPYFSFEIAIIEAMSTGLPVVVNDDSIRRNIVGESGYYVNPENIDSYSKTLKKALGSAITDRAMETAKKFDWNEISNKYESAIIELVKGR